MPLTPVVEALRYEEVQKLLWLGAGGASIVLLQSILSDERRSWGKLLAACIIGGLAAAAAGHMFADSDWVYAYCGVAAIMAENVMFGLLNASKQFREHPLNVFAQLWRIVMPSFGKVTDKPGLDLPENIVQPGGNDDEYRRGGGYRGRRGRGYDRGNYDPMDGGDAFG